MDRLNECLDTIIPITCRDNSKGNKRSFDTQQNEKNEGMRDLILTRKLNFPMFFLTERRP